MQITLTPELEELINAELETGEYVSLNDVLREALLEMQTRRIPKEIRMENLRREVMKGVEQIRNGESRVYNSAQDLVEDIKREARAEFEAKRKDDK